MPKIKILNLLATTALFTSITAVIPLLALTSCGKQHPPQKDIVVTKDTDFTAIDCSSDVWQSSITLNVAVIGSDVLASEGIFTFESIFINNIDVNNKGISLTNVSWNKTKATLTLEIDPFLLANVIKNASVSDKVADINIKYEHPNFLDEVDLITSVSINLNKVPYASTKIKPIGNYAANLTNPIVYIADDKSESDPNTLRFMQIPLGSALETTYGCSGWTVFGKKIEITTTNDSCFDANLDQDTIPEIITLDKKQYEMKNICDFKGDNITSFIVPKFIDTIGIATFCNCPNLTNLDFSLASNLVKINSGSFYDCEKIANDITIPANVTSIGDFAFFRCLSLTGLDLSLASKLNYIGIEAFSECKNLTGDLLIPASVTSIGKKAFHNGSHFNEIKIDSNNQNYVLATNLGNNCNAVLDKSNGSIFSDTSIVVAGLICGDLIFDSNMTKISKNLFSNCRGIYKLDFSKATNLTIIEEGAFAYCSNLSGDLILPNKINDIMSSKPGAGAFYNCSSLNGSIILPNNTTFKTIKNSTFWGCENVKNIQLNENIEIIEPNAFFNCNNLTTLNLMQATNLTTIGSSAFYNCFSLTDALTIPENVISIGSSAFENAISLITLDLSNAKKLATIEPNAFYNCPNLVGTLTIPASVTSIGNYAFGASENLSKANFLQNDPTKISFGIYIFCTNEVATKNSSIVIEVPTVSITSWQNIATIEDKLGIKSKAQFVAV